MTTDQEHILVLAEAGDSRLDPVALEMVAVARELASRAQGRVSAALLGGPGASAHADALVSHGVGMVYVAEHPRLTEPGVEAWIHTLGAVIQQAGPSLLLLGHTPRGRDLAPYLALRLGSGVVMGCVDLRWEASAADVEAVCPVFGGDAHAVFRFNEARPRIVTMKGGTVEAVAPGRTPPGEVVSVDPDLDSFVPRARVHQQRMVGGPRLEDARVVVAGGKGLQKEENYTYIKELAEVLGGLPTVSRPVVDAKWDSAPTQWVGLSGKVVAPDLYVAVGISGASQHMAGCSASKTIVAINSDEHASIFRYAKYGIVADCLDFLPILIEEARKFMARPYRR